MRDQDIRDVIWTRLEAAHEGDDNTLMLDELSLAHGSTRVDVAVVNGEIQGYELKSARDTLDRLEKQVEIYGRVLDRATLVVSENHAAKAKDLLPDWWGIWIATVSVGAARVELEEVRTPEFNPAPDPRSIAALLWRPEALGILETLGTDRGVRGKPRELVYARLAETLEIEALRRCVRDQLKARHNWRADRRQTRCGD